VQPLRRKVGDQRLGAAIGEHPADLPFEHLRVMKRAVLRHLQQLVVRNTAPEEEREPGCQLEIGDPIRRLRRQACGIGLDAEEEVRTDEHGRHCHLDAGVEALGLTRLPVKIERTAQIGVGHRAPIRAAHQRAQNLRRGAFLVSGIGRLRDEQPLAARRIAGACGTVRSDDRDRVDRRLNARMTI
jgi:hypothetical protein